MKITELDTKSKANHGEWLHLTHPKTGELLYGDDGKTPVRVKVHGMECDAVKQERIKRDRANMLRDIDSLITQEEFGDGVLEALIVDFDGLRDENDEVLKPTRDGKRKFLRLSEAINRQVLLFANEPSNFF